MGNYDELKAAIRQVITTNGNNEITGAILQQVLLSMVNSIGVNATFAGIATPNTNPGTADQNIFYLATEAGVYSNFNGVEITNGAAIFINKNGRWQSLSLDLLTKDNLSNSFRYYHAENYEAYKKYPIDGYLPKGVTVYNRGIRMLFAEDSSLAGRINVESGSYVVLDSDKRLAQSLNVAGDVDFFLAIPPINMATKEDLSSSLGYKYFPNVAEYNTIDTKLTKGVYIYNMGVRIAIANDSSLTGRINLNPGQGVFVDVDKNWISTLDNSGDVVFIVTALQDGIIDAKLLSDNSVTTEKILNNSVTTEKILNNSVTKEKVTFFQIGGNIFNSKTVTKDKYIVAATGEERAGANWWASDFIAVSPGVTYYMYPSLFRDYAFYDNTLNYISGNSVPIESVVAPSQAAFLRFSNYNTNPDEQNVYLSQIRIQIPYLYRIEDTVNNFKKYNGYNIKKIINVNDICELQQIHICKNILLNCIVIGGVPIKIGVGINDYYGKNIEITASEVIYKGGTEDNIILRNNHNLVLGSKIFISISKDDSNIAQVTITNELGKSFMQNIDWGIGVGKPFLKNISNTEIEGSLSFMPRDVNKEIWMFGDSYFGMYSANRWLYHILQKGYNKFLIDAKGGESAGQGIIDLQTLIQSGAFPAYIVWAHGMNGGRDVDGGVNPNWLQATISLIELCKTYNITLILSTIPSVPTEIHTQLNNWVRNSGYRYIDFSSAVETDGNYYWKGWGTENALLSDDEVHPTEQGAKVLAEQVLNDFPEISLT